MALFEKRYTNKVLLDDTEQLTSVIENARTIDGHTVCAPVFRSPFLYLRLSPSDSSLLSVFLFLSFPPPLSLSCNHLDLFVSFKAVIGIFLYILSRLYFVIVTLY